MDINTTNMKGSKLGICCILVWLGCGSAACGQTAVNASAAQAAAPAQPMDRASSLRQRAEELNRRDQERRAARIEKARQNTLNTLAGMHLGTNFLDKWDLNHNGRIDPHEWMLFRQDQEKRMAERRAAMATNAPAVAP